MAAKEFGCQNTHIQALKIQFLFSGGMPQLGMLMHAAKHYNVRSCQINFDFDLT